MALTQKGRVYLLILFANLTFSSLVIHNGFLPHLGLTLTFIFFLTLAKYIKGDNTKTTNLFYVFSLFFAAMLTLRSQSFLTFLNFVAVFVFGFLMIGGNRSLESAVSTIGSPFIIILKSVLIKSKYYLEFRKNGKSKSNTKFAEHIAGLAVTILVLAFIIPLLSSVNPLFSRLVTNILNSLKIHPPEFAESLVIWSFRLISFLFLTLMIPKLATYLGSNDGQVLKVDIPKLNLFIPKLATLIVIAVFFTTQLQLYFSSSATLASLGYSHSRYAREVFAQLSAVSAVILILLYNDSVKKKINKILTFLLSSSALFLVLMALKSAYEYSAAWGFTYKRLYGFTIALWILGIYTTYIYGYLKEKVKGFIGKVMIISGIFLVLANIVNFDYLIYNFRKSTTGSGIDYLYLSHLSADSLSFHKQIDSLENRYPNNVLSEQERNLATMEGSMILIYKITRLKEKYLDLDIREFNLMEYLQFLEIKNVNTDELRYKYETDYPHRS